MATVISLREIIETLEMQGENCLAYLDPARSEIVTATEEVRRLAESQDNLPEWQREVLREGPRHAGEQPLPAVAGPLQDS